MMYSDELCIFRLTTFFVLQVLHRTIGRYDNGIKRSLIFFRPQAKILQNSQAWLGAAAAASSTSQLGNMSGKYMKENCFVHTLPSNFQKPIFRGKSFPLRRFHGIFILAVHCVRVHRSCVGLPLIIKILQQNIHFTSINIYQKLNPLR